MSKVRQYFGTDGIRGRVGDANVNPEFMLKLGWAVGRVLAKEGGSKVFIGKDTRISGYMFEAALEAGLAAAGVDIHLLGPMPTPAVAYLTRTLRAQAGIVISASHNPYHDNGIKFFSQFGTKLADEVELAIEAQLTEPFTTVDSAKLGKAHRMIDAPGRYIEFCKSTLDHGVNLSGLTIAVDCANGATYNIAPSVFRELGAEVIELGVNPDGLNINENCGATSTALLRRNVLAHEADLGVALDGDGDRVIMVDEKGNILDGDTLLYIIAMHSRPKAGEGVVGTLMSNFGLEVAFNNLNIPFKRAKVGDRYVMELLNQTGWLLGGESSGHIICRNLTTTGDGIVSALQVLAALVDKKCLASELASDLKKCPQVLINVKLNGSVDCNRLSNKNIAASVKAAEASLQDSGRVLLRMSGTEPLVRVMVEGVDETLVATLAKDIASVVESELC